MTHRRTRSLLRVLAALLCVAACSPAAASAAQAGIGGSTLSFVAGAGEINNVSVTLASGKYTIADPGRTITLPVGSTCTATTGSVACPSAGITAITIDVGDMNDTITVSPTISA